MEDVNERLREAACVGDMNLLSKLLSEGASVNNKNAMNGWTPLHWACKRNHIGVVQQLLNEGADKSIKNNDGHIPVQLSSHQDICEMLGESKTESQVHSVLPITPNYLANPPFPYASENNQQPIPMNATQPQSLQKKYGGGDVESNHVITNNQCKPSELVLKVRLANSDEKDFIEVELEETNKTFYGLMNLLCAELGVDKNLVAKIRKLPDTIVRKDKDVGRLRDLQELELVLTNKAMSATSRTYRLEPARNHETILY